VFEFFYNKSVMITFLHLNNDDIHIYIAATGATRTAWEAGKIVNKSLI